MSFNGYDGVLYRDHNDFYLRNPWLLGGGSKSNRWVGLVRRTYHFANLGDGFQLWGYWSVSAQSHFVGLTRDKKLIQVLASGLDSEEVVECMRNANR